MKKLCYITYDFFLDVDYPIVRELNKQYKVYWIVFSRISPEQRFTQEEVIEYAKKNNIDLEIIKVTSRFRSLKHLINSFYCTLRLRRLKADIYYYQEFTDPYIPLFARLFLRTKKIVVGIHDVTNHKKDNSLFRRLTKTFYINAFKNYHIYSESQKQTFLLNHPKKNILMARLTLKDFGPAKKITASEKTNFLFFGAIEYYKGLDYLIEAANLLAKEFDNFTVTIAGYAKDFSPYNKLIRNPSYFNLIIKVIPNDEIADLFVNSDFLVQPYRDVTQSGPLKIAYNYNLPSIASDFPGFREYIKDGITGYLFEPKNYLALYEVMKTVLKQSGEVRLEMKNNIKLFSEKELQLDQIIGQYTNFFEKL